MEIAKWIIVGIAVIGVVFNSGVLYNDVKTLKENTKQIWLKIDEIMKLMLRKW